MMNFRPLLDELYTPGRAVAARATEPLALGQFVSIAATGGTGPNPGVQVAPAGGRAFGLAQEHAEQGTVIGVQRGNARCFRVPTTATITAGQDLEVGDAGQPVPAATGVVVAVALAATVDGHVDLTLV